MGTTYQMGEIEREQAQQTTCFTTEQIKQSAKAAKEDTEKPCVWEIENKEERDSDLYYMFGNYTQARFMAKYFNFVEGLSGKMMFTAGGGKVLSGHSVRRSSDVEQDEVDCDMTKEWDNIIDRHLKAAAENEKKSSGQNMEP